MCLVLLQQDKLQTKLRGETCTKIVNCGQGAFIDCANCK